MKFFSAACIFTFLVTSCAKSTFTYSEGMCNYIGSYNPKKVSEVQLQNTLNKLIFPASMETNWTAWELGDIEELSLVALEAECSTRMNELEVLSFPDEESITLLKESRSVSMWKCAKACPQPPNLVGAAAIKTEAREVNILATRHRCLWFG